MARKPDKELEIPADAWARFERVVDVVSKSPPQPKTRRAASPKELKEVTELIEKGDPTDMERIAKKLGKLD